MAGEQLDEVVVRPDDVEQPQPATVAASSPADAKQQQPEFDWSSIGAATRTAKQGQPSFDWESIGPSTRPEKLKEQLTDVGEIVAPSLIRGAAGLAGIPGEISHAAQAGIDYLYPVAPGAAPRVVPPTTHPPTGEELVHAVEKFTGPLYRAKTPVGKLGEEVVEMIPGAVGMGTGMAVRGARGFIGWLSEQGKNIGRFAATPVAGGRAAEAVAPDEYKAPAKMAGNIAGGGVGAVMRPAQAAKIVKRDLPEYVTEQHIMDAGALMRQAEREGMQLTWPEALSQTTGRDVLLDTQRYLESSPHSAARMKGYIGDRANTSVEYARRQMDRGLGPSPTVPEIIGPEVGRAGETALNDARAVINNAAGPFYRAAEGIRLTQAEYAAARAVPGWMEARNAIRDNPQLQRYVRHLPDNSVGFLNEVKKFMSTRAEQSGVQATGQANRQVSAGYGEDASTIRQIALDASERHALAASRARPGGVVLNPPVNRYQVALDTEERARRENLKPLQAGPLGRMGKLGDDTTTRAAIDALFPKDGVGIGEAGITDAIRAVSARNPEAARMLVRHYLDTQLDQAINLRGVSPGAAQYAGAQFAKNVTGSPVIDTARLANLRAAVRALPNGDRVWDGFDNMFEVLRATGMRMQPGSKTAFNMQIEQGLTHGGGVATATKNALLPTQWFKKADQALSRWQAGKNLDELAHILTDPGSQGLLIRLSQLPPDSPEAAFVALRLAAIGQTSRRPTEPKEGSK